MIGIGAGYEGPELKDSHAEYLIDTISRTLKRYRTPIKPGTPRVIVVFVLAARWASRRSISADMANTPEKTTIFC